MKAKLLAQKIQTPDGTILHSKHRHDYVTHTDSNGETYMVDGGFEYRQQGMKQERALWELTKSSQEIGYE